jgi:EmrB/QacA subfamily drug resistance transporter
VTQAQAEGGVNPRRWRALTVCLLAGFMTLLDVSIVNVALPSMQAGLSASDSQLSWIVSGYALTFGLVLVPAGKLGDNFGLKRMFLAGLALFTVMSVLCGAAPSPLWLVIARLLQGAAGGLMNPQVIGLIQQLFRGKERGTAFGYYGGVIGLSTAVGPVVGGLLIQAFGFATGWRWVFFVNVPVGIVALLLGVRLLPRTERTRQRHRLDLLGVTLLGLGIACIILPLVQAEQRGAHPYWFLLGVGLALLALFVGWEHRYQRRGGEPVVNLGLLRRWSYAMGTAIGFSYFAGFTGIWLVLSLYFQQGLGYTALQAGAAGLPFAIGSGASSALGGRLAYRFGRRMIVAGMTAVALGLAGTALLVAYESSAMVWLYILGPLLLAGTGSGLVIGPNQTLTLDTVPTSEAGTDAAVLQTAQRIGSAIGIAVAASLFFAELSVSHGNFPAAGSQGLFGAAALVGLALLVGIANLIVARARRGTKQAGGAAASAAPASGSVAGTVRATRGRHPLAEVNVSVVDSAGRLAASTSTDAQGHYLLQGLAPGSYAVVTTGYLPARTSLHVNGDAATRHDVTLDGDAGTGA